MKTKTFNHFRNLFAFVGFFIIACSAAVDDSPPAVEPPVVQNNIGKYQISQDADNIMVVINTESGKIKSYYKEGGNSQRNYKWVENTNGALTVSH